MTVAAQSKADFFTISNETRNDTSGNVFINRDGAKKASGGFRFATLTFPRPESEPMFSSFLLKTLALHLLKTIMISDRVAGEVIKEADKRGVTVLLTERMSESFAILVRRYS